MSRKSRIEALLEQVIARTTSPTLTPTSPTPPTTPTLSSADLMTMMKTMGEMFAEERKETRAMVLDILQGRATMANGQQETQLIESAQPTNYDDDPLPPELLAVIERETEETLALQASLRERAVLQQRAATLQTELNLLSESEDSSPLPSENAIPPLMGE